MTRRPAVQAQTAAGTVANVTATLAYAKCSGTSVYPCSCGTGEHERHHAYPQVPGYRLHQVPWVPPRRVSAWRFLRGAKRLSGERFLFENSNTTEFQL